MNSNIKAMAVQSELVPCDATEHLTAKQCYILVNSWVTISYICYFIASFSFTTAIIIWQFQITKNKPQQMRKRIQKKIQADQQRAALAAVAGLQGRSQLVAAGYTAINGAMSTKSGLSSSLSKRSVESQNVKDII